MKGAIQIKFIQIQIRFSLQTASSIQLILPFLPTSFPLNAPSFPSRFKDSQTSVKNGDPYVIHENGTLDIHVAQPLNSGKYTCIATNILGIKENHVFLEVKGQI